VLIMAGLGCELVETRRTATAGARTFLSNAVRVALGGFAVAFCFQVSSLSLLLPILGGGCSILDTPVPTGGGVLDAVNSGE
jgi:hypothetical protein